MSQNDAEQELGTCSGDNENKKYVWPPSISGETDSRQRQSTSDQGSWLAGAASGFVMYVCLFVSVITVKNLYLFSNHNSAILVLMAALEHSPLLGHFAYVLMMLVCNIPHLLLFCIKRSKAIKWSVGILTGGGLGIVANLLLAWAFHD